MSEPDRKLICGGGFGLPEVKAFMLEELRATKTEVAVWQLPSLTFLSREMPLRQTSGLSEWHRRLRQLHDA
ncbi:MAG: hypothetical protein ACYC96_09495 [Fimbriimonadaceae bacterium]